MSRILRPRVAEAQTSRAVLGRAARLAGAAGFAALLGILVLPRVTTGQVAEPSSAAANTPPAATAGPATATTGPGLAASAAGNGGRGLLYQRILIPAQRIADAAPDAIPVPLARFTELLEQAQVRWRERALGPAAEILQAEYTARWDGQAVLAGQGVWQVRTRSEPAAGPNYILAFPGTSLAVKGLKWDGATGAANLGANQAGELLLSVPGPGRVNFAWSRRLAERHDGAHAGSLRIPPALFSELRLELPVDRRPECDGALVTLLERQNEASRSVWSIEPYRSEFQLAITPVDAGRGDAAAQDAAPQVAAPGGAAPPQPSSAAAAAASTPTSPAPESRPLLVGRQVTSYQITEAGVEIQSDVTWDYLAPTARELVCLLPPGVAVAEVLAAEQPLPRMVREDNSVRILLPAAAERTFNKLRVNAVAPITWNSPWELPIPRFVRSSLREHELHLEIADRLQLSRLQPEGARLLATEPINDPFPGRALVLSLQQPAAQVILTLNRPVPLVNATTATRVNMGERLVTATTVIRLRADRGGFFSLAAARDPAWVLDHVEADPAAALPTITDVGQRGLSLQFREAVTADAPVTLTVRSHRAVPPDRMLRGRDLRPITIAAASTTDQVVGVRADAPWKLRLVEDLNLRRAVADQVAWPAAGASAADAELLTYHDTPESDDVKFLLVSDDPPFSAQVDVTVDVSEGRIALRYRVRCEPEAAQVSQFRIRFPPSSEVANLRWHLASDAEAGLFSRLEDDASETGGQTWVLGLRRPRSVPFDVEARTQLEWPSEFQVPLPSLPDATSQTGLVAIGTRDDSRFALQRHNLVSLLVNDQPPVDGFHVRARYHFTPSEPGRLILSPARELVAGAAGTDVLVPTVTVWWQRLATFLPGWDRADHVAAYYLTSRGAARFQSRLPERAQLTAVRLNGENVEVEAAAPSPSQSPIANAVRLDLPGNRTHHLVEIAYSMPVEPAAFWQYLRLTAPVLAEQAIHREWIVWTPDHRELQQRWVTTHGGVPGWEWRLFGRGMIRRHGTPWPITSPDSWRGALGSLGRWLRGTETPGAPGAATAARTTAPAPIDTDAWPQPTLAESFERAAWNATVVRADEDQGVVVRLVDRNLMRALTWGVWLTACGLAVLLRARTGWLWLAMVGLAMGSLWLPLEIVPFPRSAMLGVATALVYAAVRPARRLPTANVADTTFSWQDSPATPATATALWWCGVTFALASSLLPAFAQDQTSRAWFGALAPHVFPVYQPVDAERQPVGEYVYLPRTFFDLLSNSADTRPAIQDQWILWRADYRGEWNHELQVPDRLASLVASFELETLVADCRWPLPWLPASLSATATLDGQPVAITTTDDMAASLLVPAAGLHRLELSIRPLLRVDANRERFEWAAPTLPTSRLTLNGARRGEPLRLPTALGAIGDESATGGLLADLGSAQPLVLECDTELPAETPPPLAVSRLEWLQVHASSLSLQLRLTFSVPHGSLSMARVEYDPRLVLLTPPTEANRDFDLLPVSPGELHVRFRGVNPAAAVVPLSFHVANHAWLPADMSKLVGLPEVSLTQHWLGVSSTPGMTATVQVPRGLPELAAEDFAASWPGSPRAPDSAYRLPVGGAPWSLVLAGRPPIITFDQQRALHVTRDVAEVELQATVDVAQAAVLYLELPTNPALRVTEIMFVKDDADVLARWSLGNDGLLSLFLSQPISGTGRLFLRGRQTIPRRGAIPLAPWQPASGVLVGETVRVTRSPDVRVTVNTVTGYVQENAADAPGETDRHQRNVATFRWQTGESAANVQLSVVPNRPQLSGRLATRLLPRDQEWTAEIDLRVAVKAGLLDVVRLVLPREVVEPIRVDAAASWWLEQPPGQARRWLMIRPLQEDDREYRFTVQANLARGSSGALRLGDVQLPDFGELNKWFILPGNAAGQHAEWRTEGLQAAEPPAEFKSLVHEQDTAYQVVRANPQLVLVESARGRGEPELRLADHRVVEDELGNLVGTSVFEMLTAGAVTGRMILPSRGKVNSVTINGVPANVVPAGSPGLAFSFGPDLFPQTIAVVWTAPRQLVDGGCRFEAPRLAGLPARVTLWTLRPRPGGRFARLLDATAEASAEQLDQARSTAWSDILREWPTSSPLDDPAAEAWKQNWQARAAAPPAIRDRAAEGELFAYFPREASTCLVAYRDGALEEPGQRMLAGLAVAVGAWLVWRLRGWTNLLNLLRRWPAVVGVAWGVAWWLWLQPSALGLVIVAATLAAQTLSQRSIAVMYRVRAARS